MPFLFLIVFIAVPITEIALLLKVGSYIGWLATLGIVILTALLGTTLLRQQGFGVLARVNEALADGRMPVEQVIEGMCLLIAGAFLLTPGLITDTVGFALLVPVIRMAVAKWTLQRILKSGSIHVATFGRGGSSGHGGRGAGPDRDGFRSEGPFAGARTGQRGRDSTGGPVIEGEFERMDEKTNPPNGRSKRS